MTTLSTALREPSSCAESPTMLRHTRDGRCSSLPVAMSWSLKRRRLSTAGPRCQQDVVQEVHDELNKWLGFSKWPCCAISKTFLAGSVPTSRSFCFEPFLGSVGFCWVGCTYQRYAHASGCFVFVSDVKALMLLSVAGFVGVTSKLESTTDGLPCREFRLTQPPDYQTLRLKRHGSTS